MSINEVLLEAAIRHLINLVMYSSNVAARVVALVRRVDADLAQRFAGLPPPDERGGVAASRVELLIAALRVKNTEVYRDVLTLMEQEAAGLSDYEVEWQLRQLRDAFPERLRLSAPPPEAVLAAALSRPFQGRLLKEWVQGLEAATAARLRDQIRIGYLEGETIEQMVRRVRGTKAQNYADGIMSISGRAAEAMVRTAVAHVANNARERVYQSNESMLKGVRWTSVLDGRTTPICRARDGLLLPLGSGPRPPAHIGCRSVTVPVTKSWRELGFDMDELPPGTRASMNGQVPADLTYGEWLKRQDRAFVERVLGRERARMFLSGRLSIDRFVTPAGRELTLAELRRLESAS